MSDSKAISCGSTHRICVAPMMDYTDRHFRYFIRLMSRYTRLYTEMVTTSAILRGEQRRFLDFHQVEHPLALQLGGCEPTALAECARIAADYGYDEINLNAGCPSDRVQSGRFGACLMTEPALVADCVAAMRAASVVPVTVKTRIGVDDNDSYEHLKTFVYTVAQAGCQVFVIHARKALLKGLSPKENREIPPLRYEIAEQLKRDFPHLGIVMNGGIRTLQAMGSHLSAFDGVMIGREACANPYLFATVDRHFFGIEEPVSTRAQVLETFIPYMLVQLQEDVPLQRLIRPLLGLLQGCPGARKWRRHLSEGAVRPWTSIEVLQDAMRLLPAAA